MHAFVFFLNSECEPNMTGTALFLFREAAPVFFFLIKKQHLLTEREGVKQHRCSCRPELSCYASASVIRLVSHCHPRARARLRGLHRVRLVWPCLHVTQCVTNPHRLNYFLHRREQEGILYYYFATVTVE